MHITRVPGSSNYFKGGIICYSNDAKMELCGVPPDLLQKHGAVSAEVAEAMATRSTPRAAQRHWTIHHGHRRPRRRFGRKTCRTRLHRDIRRESKHQQASNYARRPGIHTRTIHISRAFVAAAIPDGLNTGIKLDS